MLGFCCCAGDEKKAQEVLEQPAPVMAMPPKMDLPLKEPKADPDRFVRDETREATRSSSPDRHLTVESGYTPQDSRKPTVQSESQEVDRKPSVQSEEEDDRAQRSQNRTQTNMSQESGYASVMAMDSYKSSTMMEAYQQQWQKEGDKRVHTVTVTKEGVYNKLGLDIYVSTRDKIKKVAKVKDAGMIARHNMVYPEDAVFEDDGIESINGVAWPQKAFFDEIKNANTLTIIVNRGQYKQ